uniref:Ubiquitin-conjugating enzyme E2 2-like n=1 Tax=Dermatophagoides pteronyssinus TaxID=6956 RepID=A0A6P6Y572_DERPT|nr:ubiquitin-conjugating enzyme E2 2-like [Dermatophagoides pteronyssinus]
MTVEFTSHTLIPSTSLSLSTSSRKRLLRDFRSIVESQPEGVNATPCDNNLLEWEALVFGPDDTCWEGGVFMLSMSFPHDYPDTPPTIKFLTKIYHPNVYADGSICLDILQKEWSPVYDVSGILISIRSLLDDPNPESPANAEAARTFVSNRREYQRLVQKCVQASLEAAS